MTDDKRTEVDLIDDGIQTVSGAAGHLRDIVRGLHRIGLRDLGDEISEIASDLSMAKNDINRGWGMMLTHRVRAADDTSALMLKTGIAVATAAKS